MSARSGGVVADTLRRLAAQQKPARHEHIGQRAGHEQVMSVLLRPAIAHLGKAEHRLDDPDRMFDPGPHFGLGTILRPLADSGGSRPRIRDDVAQINGASAGPTSVVTHSVDSQEQWTVRCWACGSDRMCDCQRGRPGTAASD